MTDLERISEKTGRKPSACACNTCVQQCKIPCLGTPQDILTLINNGYADALAPTAWAAGIVMGLMDRPIYMVQLKQEESGCILFKDGRCTIHSLGIKPTEGVLSNHIPTINTIPISLAVALEWEDARNNKALELIIKAIK